MGDVVAQYEESFILDAALRKLTLRMNNVYRKKNHRILKPNVNLITALA